MNGRSRSPMQRRGSVGREEWRARRRWEPRAAGPGRGRESHRAGGPERGCEGHPQRLGCGRRKWGVGRPGCGQGEWGGATVFACVALVGLIAAALSIGQVGAAVVARHRAQAGADLAALAAAGALDGGVEAGCAAGEKVARRMGARISECRVDGWDATVTVARNVPMGLFGARTVHAIARAGPVEEEE